ncbi:superoxide dismutase family protein [Paenibacillus solisilvae]|uniref:Superoxide dismutase [Cu-Zn] n=1 Tax=Paenibacillus solisilvae TaxID=2486751 RepID=A0ABW0VV35_9BACL
MRKFVASVCISAVSFLLSGAVCLTPAVSAHHQEDHPVKVMIMNTKGEQIGTAMLTQSQDTVRIHIEAKNLPPGIHGIHFHETGKCEAPNFASAGAHLNIQNKQHGFNNPQGFHTGDLPNIQVKADGTVVADIESKVASLTHGAQSSLLKSGGTALVIHEKADDYVTDPSGNSGDRIACGVIQ